MRHIDWLLNLLQDVGMVQKAPTFFYNQGAIHPSKNTKIISAQNILMFSIIMFVKAKQKG